MYQTIRRVARPALALLAVGAMTIILAVPVVASHLVVRTSFPSAATVGESVSLAVDLGTADGAPLAGATVTYYLHMSFAGVEGDGVIGRAVTDDAGVAAIHYLPRAAGLHEVRIEYLAPGAATIEEVLGTFDVAGGEQLYRSAGGVDIPGIGPGLLMAVLGGVWLLLLSVAFRLVGIVRASGREDPSAGAAPR
jgi:hypothetical protein